MAAPKSTAGPPVKKAKAPIMEKVRNKWAIENQGETTLVFEGDQVDKRIAFAIFDCKGTTIEIKGKCQNISLQNCQRVTLIIDKIVGQCELGGCKVIKINCKNATPDAGPGSVGMITAENCNEVVITLQNDYKGAKVSTICCRSVIVKWPKEGSTDQQCEESPAEHLNSVPVAEVYES